MTRILYVLSLLLCALPWELSGDSETSKHLDEVVRSAKIISSLSGENQKIAEMLARIMQIDPDIILKLNQLPLPSQTLSDILKECGEQTDCFIKKINESVFHE